MRHYARDARDVPIGLSTGKRRGLATSSFFVYAVIVSFASLDSFSPHAGALPVE
jgi:hypothetical protein